ncbi:hypothetical protein CFBP6773_00513 [Xanthomonas arboricola pv. fragariae]|nr:hypothetical protein CFBP6773_00513 [Xanthomonas arboricola pv. fragariae]
MSAASSALGSNSTCRVPSSSPIRSRRGGRSASAVTHTSATAEAPQRAAGSRPPLIKPRPCTTNRTCPVAGFQRWMDCARPSAGSVMVKSTSAFPGRHCTALIALSTQAAAVQRTALRACAPGRTDSATCGRNSWPLPSPTRDSTATAPPGAGTDCHTSPSTPCVLTGDSSAGTGASASGRVVAVARSSASQCSGTSADKPVRSNHTVPKRCVARRPCTLPERNRPCPSGTVSSIRMPCAYSSCSAAMTCARVAPTR